MINFINLTPHPITVCDEAGNITLNILPSGTIARVDMEYQEVPSVLGVPCRRQSSKGIVGLPEANLSADSCYIVSTMVLSHPVCSGRNDVVSPDTNPGSVVRSDSGQIIGVRGFLRP